LLVQFGLLQVAGVGWVVDQGGLVVLLRLQAGYVLGVAALFVGGYLGFQVGCKLFVGR
jgi:hypothetical protein